MFGTSIVVCLVLSFSSTVIGKRTAVAVVKDHEFFSANVSNGECSCWKGFKPGVGIPFIGSLYCWEPLSCGKKCSSIFEKSCKMKAMCTYNAGSGQHHCDCSMCSGPTKAQVAYEAACKTAACLANEKCYVNGTYYGPSGGSSWSSRMPEGVSCQCEYPNVRKASGECIALP
eukprot:TRINITY_DN17093_c0_g1_i1.p1 TRINITY_DN17093_c0_g1~~TRINITY_DN17093_c0_g1_i1.p1  ORF type:complete len:172 (+),score=15.11 TRINITY_DN17093_c0_g1_i1:73-588(+)